LFSSMCSISLSISDMARATRGSSRSGIGPSSAPASGPAAGCSSPRGMANALTCLISFRWPHLGQTGARSGCSLLERKLKILRHRGQANS
jgi:hypothetical protein